MDILSLAASVDKIKILGLDYSLILYSVCFAVLVFGSITDLKKREVLDYLSYFLIIASFGIRGIYSIVYSDISILLSGVIGFLIFLSLSVALYYTGQWGGGDSKVLMGLGAGIGFYLPRSFSSDASIFLDFFHHGIVRYVIFVLLFGAIYSVIWSIVLAIMNKKKVFEEFKNNFCFMGPYRIIADFFSGAIEKKVPDEKSMIILGEVKKNNTNEIDKQNRRENITVHMQRYNYMSFARLFIYLLLIISMSAFPFSNNLVRNLLVFTSMTVVLMYFLVLMLKSIESVSMIKTVGIDKISEGEWIYLDYFVMKKKSETLGEFLKRKIEGNVILTIPYTLKDKKDFDRKVAEETIGQYSESVKEMEKLVFTYSHSKVVSSLRSIRFIFFKHTKAFSRYSGYVKSLLDAKDKQEFEKVSVKIHSYNNQFDHDTLFNMLNFSYDMEYVCGPSQLGIDLDGIDMLKKNGVKFLQIRQGIPFVPSFLLAFVFFILL